jgi:hypothetical protein
MLCVQECTTLCLISPLTNEIIAKYAYWVCQNGKKFPNFPLCFLVNFNHFFSALSCFSVGLVYSMLCMERSVWILCLWWYAHWPIKASLLSFYMQRLQSMHIEFTRIGKFTQNLSGQCFFRNVLPLFYLGKFGNFLIHYTILWSRHVYMLCMWRSVQLLC